MRPFSREEQRKDWSDRSPIIIEILREPTRAHELRMRDWDFLIRQARAARLLGHLHARFADEGLLHAVPERPLAHLVSAHILADRQRALVVWEADQVRSVLADLDVPIVLLKGAAYALADLPPAQGRLFSDIDIMVPKRVLQTVEQRLHGSGWMTTHLDDYDQRYYRKWMHELPPMQHVHRRTTLDVHHTILPETARARPDADQLLRDRQPLQWQGLYVLAPEDLILHSATHLFFDGEFDHGLRDLVDIERLIEHFRLRPGFWNTLLAHSRHHGLFRPLYYALLQAQRLLGCSVPEEVMLELRRAHRGAPVLRRVMDTTFSKALYPVHPSCSGPTNELARGLLYIRGHYLRMPAHLLVPHLLRKSFRGVGSQAADDA